MQRIQFLDGLRGIAIFFVLLFHAYSRWPGIVPYGTEFEQVLLFKNGWLGVYLFFMISGFVIFMSLEKSRNFQDFFIKRWIRLFPAMLACSLVVFLTASFFYERPAGTPVLRDLLPGLTFIEPYWWQLITGSPQGLLEGAFWSLFVEIKLYFVAGIFYFLIGGQRMIWVLVFLFLVAVITPFFNHVFEENGWNQARTILYAFSGQPCGWFAAGALFYRYYKEQEKRLFITAVVVAMASAFAIGRGDYGREVFVWDEASAAIFVVLLFTAAILNDRVKNILSSRMLLFMGFISYPLYLIHENMMISLIVKTNSVMPWIPSILLPTIPIVFIIGVAWLIAKFVDPPARAFLKEQHLKIQQTLL
jgi:peptidoglycan/LPS O-acetylase OafA/YrhL